MANTVVSSGQLITASKGGELTSGTTAPASPTLGWLWLDENYSPPVLKVYTGTDWVPVYQNDYELFASFAMRTLSTPKLTDVLLAEFDLINLASYQSFRVLAWGGCSASSADIRVSLNGGSVVAQAGGNGITDDWFMDLDIGPSGLCRSTLYGYFSGSVLSTSINSTPTTITSVGIYGYIGSGPSTAKLTATIAGYVRR